VLRLFSLHKYCTALGLLEFGYGLCSSVLPVVLGSAVLSCLWVWGLCGLLIHYDVSSRLLGLDGPSCFWLFCNPADGIPSDT